MLDINDFDRAKQRLFKEINQIHTLPELKEYLLDLKFVCANERSLKLSKLLLRIINKTKKMENHCVLFELCWLYYLQTYFHTQKLEQTEELLREMRRIVENNDDKEKQAIIHLASSLLEKLKGNERLSYDEISKAMKLISTCQKNYPDTFHQILYTHSFFISLRDQNYSKAIKEIKECISYYFKSNNSLGLIKAIFLLLRFYTLSGEENKSDELLQWVFEHEKIQERIIDAHYSLLYGFVGTISAIVNKIENAIDYLSKAYTKILEKDLQIELMYDYTEIVRLLSRCYSYKGQFEHAYNLIVELISFMESDFVKENYYNLGIKRIYFSSYYTFLFIFVQLDLDISTLQDDKLKQVHEYITSLLTETEISKKLVLDATLDEEAMKILLESETEQSKEEVYLALHQLLTTHTSYDAPEKAVETIQIIREYAFDPLYADILLSKVYLAKGNYIEFKNIAKQIKENITSAKAPILKIWSKFFSILSKYLDELGNQNILKELKELEIECKKKNFRKMAEEIILYQRLISSTSTTKRFEDRFQQTAFMDVFNEQSKKMVIEYLDEQKTS